MWSVGCILAELLGRRPIFPGSDSYHQLALMIEVLGKPSEQFMQQIRLDNVRKYVRDLADKLPKQFSTMYPQANPLAIDLLSKLLVFEPANRLTVHQALEHPYLASLHCPEDEVTRACSILAAAVRVGLIILVAHLHFLPGAQPSGPPIPRSEFAFERGPCTKASLRAEIIREIRYYHSPPSLVVKNHSGQQETKSEEDTNSAPVPSQQGTPLNSAHDLKQQAQSPAGAASDPSMGHARVQKQHPAVERISDEVR